MHVFDRKSRLLIADDICPDCSGSLDVGWECNDCGKDFMWNAFARFTLKDKFIVIWYKITFFIRYWVLKKEAL